jgi:two-component system phosphate regulon response regulator OmpR
LNRYPSFQELAPAPPGAGALFRAAPAVTPTAKLLLIDDDARLTAMVGDYLRNAGYDVETAPTLAAGHERLASAPFDALLLDLMLPDGDGLDFCRHLRGPAARRRAAAADVERARRTDGPRASAWNWAPTITWPSPSSRASCWRASRRLLRRGGAAAWCGAERAAPSVASRSTSGRAWRAWTGRRCDLTSHQFELLAVLAQSAGRVMTRDQIMDALQAAIRWTPSTAAIDVHISRASVPSIEDDAKTPKRVLTVRGAGYVFARKQDEDTG